MEIVGDVLPGVGDHCAPVIATPEFGGKGGVNDFGQPVLKGSLAGGVPIVFDQVGGAYPIGDVAAHGQRAIAGLQGINLLEVADRIADLRGVCLLCVS